MNHKVYKKELYEENHYEQKPNLDQVSLEDKVIDMFRYLEEDQDRQLFAGYVEALIREFNEENLLTHQTFAQIESKFQEGHIPELPCTVKAYMDQLKADVIQNVVHVNKPTFIGHMTSALPYFMRTMANLIVAMNQNVVKVETSKGMTPCERQIIGMMHQLIFKKSNAFYDEYMQDRDGALGGITSGGTIANMTALWCARNRLLGPQQDFGGVERAGLKKAMDYYGYKELAIIGSKNMHYSFQKAVTLLGIGEDNLISVGDDSDGNMDMKDLQKIIQRCKEEKIGIIALIGVAGATNSGKIDPLVQIGKIAKEENIYFHVDAAWGGPVMFSHKYSYLLEGIQEAHSVTIDGHKQLYLPMGCGMVLFKDPELPKGIQKNTSYVLRQTSADLGKFSLEGSRPAVSLYMHAALHLLGKKGYEVLINRGIDYVRYAAFYISNLEEFELIEEPDINILNYRIIPEHLMSKWKAHELTEEDHLYMDEFNKRIQKLQRENEQSFVSRTQVKCAKYPRVEKILVLRMVIANPLTSKEDIKNIFEEQRQYAKTIGQFM